jgi:chromosome segregation ATPase
MIESLVAVLLLLTTGYCILLNGRLKRLKADEQALKATISELITATEIAERAIAGLKLTVRDCDQNLGERLRTAERFSGEIARQLEAGESILERLAQIAVAARPSEPVAKPQSVPTTAQATAAAAQAFAARARLRKGGVAA